MLIGSRELPLTGEPFLQGFVVIVGTRFGIPSRDIWELNR